MQERKTRPKPFQQSLSALAQVATRETGAEGYAFFRRHAETSVLVRQEADGATIPEEAIGGQNTDPVIAAYSLGTDGIVAFTFRDGSESRLARTRLDGFVPAIEAVWTAAGNAWQNSLLASQIADLEARLMDSKIADRVRGFLKTGGDPNALDAIARHVDGVLRPAPTRRILEQLSRELEEAVEERRLTNRAKAILQIQHGMSEDEAHMHLRQTSRRSRKKLREVAADLIDSHPAERSRVPSMQ